MSQRRLKTIDFEFDLPEERIAQRPRPYDEQKLLHLDRSSGSISHHLFQEIPRILRPGDLLVLNDTKVIPAALRLKDGSFVLFTNPLEDSFTDTRVICPFKPSVGETIRFPGLSVEMELKKHEPGWDVYLADIHFPSSEPDSLLDFLKQSGAHPIPTYIHRNPDRSDVEDYQNVYANTEGSIACPVAGLHFNQELLDILASKGVEITHITLHVGYGTFRSFKTEFVDQHKADSEQIHITQEALRAIGEAAREGRRIIAIGSTSARTLESISDEVLAFEQIQGDISKVTDLFISPPYEFKVISGLVTNLPYPKIPVMSMAAAWMGLDALKDIIEIALAEDYLFYSYGDAILAL